MRCGDVGGLTGVFDEVIELVDLVLVDAGSLNHLPLARANGDGVVVRVALNKDGPAISRRRLAQQHRQDAQGVFTGVIRKFDFKNVRSDGEHTDAAVCASVTFMPSCAIRSIFGVLIFVAL